MGLSASDGSRARGTNLIRDTELIEERDENSGSEVLKRSLLM